MSLLHLYGLTIEFLRQSIHGLPPDLWWVPACVLLVLGATATVDALSGIIPDLVILPAIAALVFLLGNYLSWNVALHNLGYGVAGYVIVWALNLMWFLIFKRDALGLGDAKWSLLAVTAFGIQPVLIAWGLGAWLAILWIAAAKLLRRPVAYVHFAPFLFAGLLAGLWWLELGRN